MFLRCERKRADLEKGSLVFKGHNDVAQGVVNVQAGVGGAMTGVC